MATDYLTTLHPYKDRKKKNAFPNVKDENIPSSIQRKLKAGENISISDDNTISSSNNYKYILSIIYDYETMNPVSAVFEKNIVPTKGKDLHQLRVIVKNKNNDHRGTCTAVAASFSNSRANPKEHRILINFNAYNKPSINQTKQAYESSYYFTYNEDNGEVTNISIDNYYEPFTEYNYYLNLQHSFEDTDTIKHNYIDNDRYIEFHLDNSVLNKINKSLQLPVSATDTTELAGFNKSGQQNISLDNIFILSNNILSVSNESLIKKEAVINNAEFDINVDDHKIVYFLISYYKTGNNTIIIDNNEYPISENVITSLNIVGNTIYIHNGKGDVISYDYNNKISIHSGQDSPLLIMSIRE